MCVPGVFRVWSGCGPGVFRVCSGCVSGVSVLHLLRSQEKKLQDAKQLDGEPAKKKKKPVQAKAETVSSSSERVSRSSERVSRSIGSAASAGGSSATGALLLSCNLAPALGVLAPPRAETVLNLQPLKDAAHFAKSDRARGVLRCRECKTKCYFYCVCSPDPTKPIGLVALCGLATGRACFTTHKQNAGLHGHSVLSS